MISIYNVFIDALSAYIKFNWCILILTKDNFLYMCDTDSLLQTSADSFYTNIKWGGLFGLCCRNLLIVQQSIEHFVFSFLLCVLDQTPTLLLCWDCSWETVTCIFSFLGLVFAITAIALKCVILWFSSSACGLVPLLQPSRFLSGSPRPWLLTPGSFPGEGGGGVRVRAGALV